MTCLERREGDKCTIIEGMTDTIENLNEKVEDLENIVTIVTRLLLNNNIYQIEDIVDEYEKLKEEKSTEKKLNKINLEGDIEVNDGVQGQENK